MEILTGALPRLELVGVHVLSRLPFSFGVAMKPPGMDADLPVVELRIWQSDAIVLSDWLMSTDLNTVPISHPAQKQALADLLTRLEVSIDTSVTRQQIEIAQSEVARDMGW